MNKRILLTGPFCAGKTSLGMIVSEALGLPFVPIDRAKWFWMLKNGFSFLKAKEIVKTRGYKAVVDYYLENFSSELLENVLLNFDNGIYEIPPYNLFHHSVKKVQRDRILQFFDEVILLLPDKSISRTTSILNGRIKNRLESGNSDFDISVAKEYKELNCQYIEAFFNLNSLNKFFTTEELSTDARNLVEIIKTTHNKK